MVKTSPFSHQPEGVARKASDVSAADWRYPTHVKNIVFFHVCCYSFSQGWKSLYNTVVHMINRTNSIALFNVKICLFMRRVYKYFTSNLNIKLRSK